MSQPIDWADYQAISDGTKWDSYCKLQDRIDELEDIIRESFVVLANGAGSLVLPLRQLPEDASAIVIELCKPRPEAPQPREGGS